MNSPHRALARQPHEFETESPALAVSHAFQHGELLAASLRLTQQIAELIIEGGDLYSPGVRDLARRLAEDSAAIALSLRAIEPES